MPSWGWEEGAFKYGQRYDDTAEVDSFQFRRAHAILGYKDLLQRVTNRKVKDTPAFGDATKNAVKDVQAANGMPVDGILGFQTARVLCWCSHSSIVREVESDMGVPNQYVGRIGALESEYYLAARYELDSGNDRGAFQIHDSFEPAQDYRNVEKQARWTADRLIATHRKLKEEHPGHTWTQYWWSAIFAHNAPAWAPEWLDANCPTSGGGTIHVGNWEGDKFAWATLYTHAVLNRRCQ